MPNCYKQKAGCLEMLSSISRQPLFSKIFPYYFHDSASQYRKSCSGANPIILKRQFRVSSPKFSQILIGKQNHEITASRIQSVFTPETLYSLYFQGFFSPYPEKQNDLIERIFPLYKVVLLLLILFLGLPQIAFAGYSGVPRDKSSDTTENTSHRSQISSYPVRRKY